MMIFITWRGGDTVTEPAAPAGCTPHEHLSSAAGLRLCQMLLLQLFCKAHLDLRINLPLVHVAAVLHRVLQQLPRAGRAQHRRVLLLLEGARFVADGDPVPAGQGKVSLTGCWPSGRGDEGPGRGYLPVDLLFHVGGVAAAVVGEQQPAVVEPVHVDLDVGAVHDDHVGGQRLAGDLRAGTASVQPQNTLNSEAGGWAGTSPRSVQSAATGWGCAAKAGGTTSGCTEELFNSAQSWFNSQPTTGLTHSLELNSQPRASLTHSPEPV